VARFELVVAGARLRGQSGRHDIAVSAGRIAAIEPAGGDLNAALTLPAEGRLVTESFVDAHLHLCKVHTLERVGEEALRHYAAAGMGGAMTAIEIASAVKEDYAEDWIHANARQALLDGLRHGVTRVQAFADTDTKARLEAVRALLRLRDELRGVVTVEVVAFPQDGVLRDPGAEDLVREALELGADVVGGIPWIEHTDAESAEHVRRMLDLAVRFDRRVAMLTDDAGDPGLRTTEMLATGMLERGLEGRGVACHARAVDLYPEPAFRRLVGLVRRAGLAFVTDPHTGPVRLRSLDLLAAGVPVAIGQDDIVDAYYPYGRHNLLEVAFLASHLLGATTLDRMDQLFDMVTGGAARVLGDDGHRLRVGAPADLVVLDGDSVHEALLRHAAPRYVVSNGRLVAETTTGSVLHGVG